MVPARSSERPMYAPSFYPPSRSFPRALRDVREVSESTLESEGDEGDEGMRSRTASSGSSLGPWCEIGEIGETGEGGRVAARPEDFGAADSDPSRACTDPRPAIDSALQAGLDETLAYFPARDLEQARAVVLVRLDRRLCESLHRLDQPAVRQALDRAWAETHREIDALLDDAQGTAGRPLTEPEQAVFQHLQQTVLRAAFELFPAAAEDHAADARAVMRRAAVALVDQGLTTPAAVDRWLQRAQAHDHLLQVLMGGAGQLGYAAGFYLFSLLLAPRLAPQLLGRGWMPAFAFGSLAGLVVGLCDALTTAGAQRVADGMAYQGRHTPGATAAALMLPNARRIATNAAIGGGTTFLKNFLLRVLVQSLAIEALAPEGIDRGLRGRTDLALDAAGGVFSGALAGHLRSVLLDDPHTQAFRLLAGDDLAGLVSQVERPLAHEDLEQALRLFAQGVGRATAAPSTYVVVLGTVAPMVGALLAAQNALPPGLGALAQVGQVAHAASAAASAAQVLGADLRPDLPVQAYENAVRAGVSTVMMSLMAAFATTVGGAAGPRLDSLALRRHLLDALDRVRVLRRPDSADGPALDATVRRRSASP